jgi:hypothetical protein
LLVVFVSGLADPGELLAGVAEASPGTPVVGCSSEGVIGPDPDGEPAPAVVVTALGGPGFTVHTADGSCAGGAQRLGGARVAQCAAKATGNPVGQVLLLLTDGWVSAQEEILAGAYGVVGASMPLVGGSASPDPVTGRPYQLHGREVLTESVVGAVISSDGPFGIGLRHGWRKVGEAMLVTESIKGDVHMLDDQPALTAYLERLSAPWQAYSDPRTFEIFARSRPIGIRRRDGEEVRGVASAAGLRGGWLRSNGEVPEGGLVWLMEGDEDSVLNAASEACREAIERLGGAEPLGLLAFDCVSRVRMLGDEGGRQEVDRMREQAGGAPVAGAYTWGEISRTRGINGYHNQTLAVLAVG